jgi:hypothetical protein
MKTYKEFIDRMIEKGYTLVSNNPVTIDESNSIIKTFPTKKNTVCKILELECPYNSVIAICGTEHNGGCHNLYTCNIELTDNDNKQPFQKLHHSTALTSTKHIVAEIIVTKILQQDPPLDNKKVKEWSETIGPILKLIKSNNNREHVMWMGAYPKFNSDFIKTSFTLYGGQKMIFYANNPDVDIDKVKLNISLDIFEKLT